MGRGASRAFEDRFDHDLRIHGLRRGSARSGESDRAVALAFRSRRTPAPKMVYRVSENSRRILDFGMDRASEVLRSAGAEELYRTPLRAEAGFHLMGTARMGVDPDRSVVDRLGRCHDVPNLFIADASVFVTSTAVNPTATAQALALRTAEHIVATDCVKTSESETRSAD